MKLGNKGLLVVSVPLAFQILTVSILAVLLWRAQEIAANEAHVKDVVYQCNHMTLDVAKTIQSIFRTDPVTGNRHGRRLAQSDIEQIHRSVTALQEQLRDEPAEAANLQKLTSFSDKFIEELTEARAAAFSKDPAIKGTSDVLEFHMLSTAVRLFTIFKNTISVETKLHPENPEPSAGARASIRIWLVAALLITAGVAVALAYFCFITIKKPLQRMTENAARISRRQPLEPPLLGDDELSDLDRVLHSVNDAIEEALNNERNLISYAADLVFSVDHDGIFLSVNPFSKTMLGYEPAELIGKSVLDCVSPEHREQVRQVFSSAYEDDESRIFETNMQGKVDLIETSWSVIYSARDQTFFCVAHNISERKHVERLKQDFIAMISHDLRTPLMSVSSSINLVQSGATGEITPVVERELNSAERSVDHLIELVNDLLDFEKLEAGRMNFELMPIKISSVIEQSLSLIAALAEDRSVSIETEFEDFTVIGDERKLIQVTVNLLSNALKHSPKNGVIKIQTATTKDMVDVSFHDQGPGVPDEYAESIFAPFEQISHRSTAALGTGLGLAICKLIVEGHGGKIAVRHSNLLSGSAFWFTLQRGDENTVASTTKTSVGLR